MSYELSPWKIDLCRTPLSECERDWAMEFEHDLPDPPTPDRLQGYDHAHIAPRFSADQRGARDDQRWRSLLLAIGRAHEPGEVLGHMRESGGKEAADKGKAIVVPAPELDRRDRANWLRDA